ncbi:MAG: hypothetical protein ACKOQT_03140, partial [Acidimicrobiaceae bacterium]
LGGVATPLEWCIDRDGEQNEQHSIQQNWSPNKFKASGFEFIWRPVLLNGVLLVLLAVAINSPFKWRRYPAKT